MHETDLRRKSEENSKPTKHAIIRPKVNISEKVLLDRIQELNISSILDLILTEYNVSPEQKRNIDRGGKYYRWIGVGHQLTREMIVKVIQQVFEEYRDRERVSKEKELAESKPEVVVLNASKLLHSE